MIPPSTKSAPPAWTTAASSRTVAGATAFASTKAPSKPGTDFAISSAACGGQTERITSLRRTSSSTEPTSSNPASSARPRVSAPRPADAHTTRWPWPRRTVPTAAPISPGCRRPIVGAVITLDPNDRLVGRCRMTPREQEFVEYVQSGGQVETDDWLPDDYRAKLIKFIEMHGNSELMGVLPEREWILRAPTLQRKLALTAKVQDEVGHSQLIYRVVEDLGKPREQCLDDLISGKSKFHNVFHYPTKTWGDVGVIAWLVDAAAIISQKALLKCSYAPYARIMKKICWEESFHILHGRDVILTLMNGTDAQRELVQEALDRWWGPLMQFHGNPIARDDDPMWIWRIKSQGNEEARQQFLEGYVPQIWELGLTVPDADLRKNDDGVWEYTEPDWDELRSVVTGHGPKSQDRLDLRRKARESSAWVRQVVLAEAA